MAEGNGGGWSINRRDGIYAALLALSFGGERVLDRGSDADVRRAIVIGAAFN